MAPATEAHHLQRPDRGTISNSLVATRTGEDISFRASREGRRLEMPGQQTLWLGNWKCVTHAQHFQHPCTSASPPSFGKFGIFIPFQSIPEKMWAIESHQRCPFGRMRGSNSDSKAWLKGLWPKSWHSPAVQEQAARVTVREDLLAYIQRQG